MIFSTLRISELERDRDEKRALFESSKRRLAHALREKTRPLTFLKEHPRLALSGLATLLSMGRFMTRFVTNGSSNGNKKTLLAQVVRLGWALRAYRIGRSLLKTFRDFQD